MCIIHGTPLMTQRQNITILLQSYSSRLFLDLFWLGWGQRLQILWSATFRSLTNLLPRGESFKVAEGLRELKRFVDNALSLFIISDFSIARQGEILAKRVALEAIICEYTPEVWMSLEENSVKVPSLALIPICTPIDFNSAGNWIRLSSISLHPDPSAKLHAQQGIYDFKPLLPLWEVDTGDIHTSFELAL